MARLFSFLFMAAITATALAESPAPSSASAQPASPAAAASASPAAMAATGAPEVSGASATSTQAATPPAARISWSRVNVDGAPYIAMTFDDGPSGPNTPKLLDLAAKKHIKLTFFEVGQNVALHPEIVQRILAEGHEIGNHSWSHPDFAKMSDDAVRAELQKTQDAIVKASGYRPTLMRPPYGAITARQRLWINKEFNYKIILWDVDPLDWKRPGVSVVANRIISGARSGSIILSHDIHAPTIEAMPQVFDALLAKGFKFVTVSELLAMDKGPVHPATKKPAASTSTRAAAGTAAVIPASTQ